MEKNKMRILIIARNFAPDSGIATIRPTKFAKYLSKLGHEVVVIRSGSVSGKPEADNLIGLENVKIYSYDNNYDCNSNSDESISEKRGNPYVQNAEKSKSYNRYISKVKGLIKLFYDPIVYYYRSGYLIKKKILRLYNTNEELRGFDIVLSTFNPMGTIQAGAVISKKEGSKWIIDFRDLMDSLTLSSLLRKTNRIIQTIYCSQCDACLCVSKGNAERLSSTSMKKRKDDVFVLHNGFDSESNETHVDKEMTTKDSKIHICYTGTLHKGRSNSSALFKAITNEKLQGKVIIDYAGKDGNELVRQAKQYGCGQLIYDHGYLSRSETAKLQKESDLFLVLSWNTEKDQGVLTGKFYEALQHRRPIIAIVTGEVSHSELNQLIHKYNLGICYEDATSKESLRILGDYLKMQCERKTSGRNIYYEPYESAFHQFEYEVIVKELEGIMIGLLTNKGQ